MTKRALIIGGGIAGTVAAMAVQRAGLDPVIHEAYGAGSDGTGAFLTLAVNGLAALEAAGLREQVCALGMDTPGMTMISGRDGSELGTLGMRARTIARADLYQALRDEALARGIPIEYGKRLTQASPVPDGVRACFADGTTATGDLLIGADGLRSRSRTLVDPQAPPARYIGLLNTGGYAEGIDLPGEPGRAYMIFGKQCFFGYFIQPDTGVWWFANPPARQELPREQLQAIGPEQWRERLTGLFAADTGPMLDVIAATPRIFPPWATYDLPRVPVWHHGRMVLIGDAVHATSPSSGQGASMAIEDAVALAMCLRDLPEPPDAFAAFTRARRQRVEKVVRHGKRSGSGKAAGPAAARIRDLMLPLVLRRLAQGHSLDWMYDYRIDWDAGVSQLTS